MIDEVLRDNEFIIEYLEDCEIIKCSLDKDNKKCMYVDKKTELGRNILYLEENKIYRNSNNIRLRVIKKADNLKCTINIDTLINELMLFNEDGFYHETDLKNIVSIAKMGLYSREYLEENNIKFEDLSKINETTARCLSLTKKNIKRCARLYLAKNNPANYRITNHSCILVVDFNILKDKRLKIHMTNGKTYSNPNLEINSINNPVELKEILRYNFEKIYSKYEKYNKINNDALKNYRLAELLVDNCVEPKYFKKIIFKNEEDKKKYIDIMSECGIKCEVDSSYFKKGC